MREARPGLQAAPETLELAIPVLEQARALVAPAELPALLDQLDPAVRSLARLEPDLTELLGDVTPVTECLRVNAVPTLKKQIDDPPHSTGEPVYRELLYAVVGLASASQNFDGNGPAVRYHAGRRRHERDDGRGTVDRRVARGPDRRADPRLAAALDRAAPAVPPRRAVRLAGSARPDRGDRPGAAAAAGVGVRHGTARRRTRPAPGAVAMRIFRNNRTFRDRRSLVEFLAIVGLVLLAIPVSAYILDHQRLRWPWEDVITLEAEFSNAQAVAPGQGQNVTVAGRRGRRDQRRSRPRTGWRS